MSSGKPGPNTAKPSGWRLKSKARDTASAAERIKRKPNKKPLPKPCANCTARKKLKARGPKLKMENILIKNGRVIDPANNLDAARDVLIEDGKIKAVKSKL